MDLLVASPATVSRCGMVYMQPQELGWECCFVSWMAVMPKFFKIEGNEKYTAQIEELVEIIVQPCLDFIRDGIVQEATPTVDQNLIVGMLRNFTVLLAPFNEEAFYKELDKKVIATTIDYCFIYSCIWSICISCDTDGRKKFDKHFKAICEGSLDHLKKFSRKVLHNCFDRGTIYDYVYNSTENHWKPWTEMAGNEPRDKFPEGTVVQDIVVTTIDSLRYSYIMENNIINKIPTLFVGPTGTGKTAYIQNVLSQKLPQDKFLAIECGFSAQSKSNMVQDLVDLKMDQKRGKRGNFGPKLGFRAVVFVDDLNMPNSESSGAMPPVEILRQWMDQGGWYDRKEPSHPFRNLIDGMLVCAMGPPGGGKSVITPRFQRHFNTISFSFSDENTMKSIFSSILSYYFRTGGFAPEIVAMNEKIVMATLTVYRRIQEDLRPTPVKSHYTFNLRDVSKVICGFCSIEKDALPNTDVGIRLWAHETVRVFGDRLINDQDRRWMMEAV